MQVLRGLYSVGLFLWVSSFAGPALSQSVTTYHNDVQRTGANSAETALNTSNVTTGIFGKLFSLPVDAQIYAQPLYVPSVAIPGKGTHNVLYVATENNSVYAFDGDSPSQVLLWHVNLGPAVQTSSLLTDGCSDLCPQVGITSTPVIDLSRQAIYVAAEETNAQGQPVFYLHSLNIANGLERTGSPILISGQVSGSGTGSSNGVLVFSAQELFQRPALLEINGDIYVAFGAHQDNGNWNGWIFSYDGLSLRRLAVKCTTPNGSGAGIWQGGAGLASDGLGNIYAATGNGDFTAAYGGSDYGDSVIKLDAVGLAVTSYFSPWNTATLDSGDSDLGSGGVLVMPGSVVQLAPLLVAGGKDGIMIVLNTANLGGFNSSSDAGDTVQEWQATAPSYTSGLYGGSVYFNSNLYYWGGSETLQQYFFDGTSFSLAASGSFTIPTGGNATGAMSISSDAGAPGSSILWAPTGAVGER